MSVELHTDFESRGVVVPGDVGGHNYIYHPETEFLFNWYAFDKEEPRLWKIWEGEPIPRDLADALRDPSVVLTAFNSFFERHGFTRLGHPTAIDRWLDPQVGGRVLSLPASLEDQSTILGLPAHLAKDKRGEELIKLFCEKHQTKKKKGEEQRLFYNDWNSHPKEWAKFLAYGSQDVVAERELLRRMYVLDALPLSEFEKKLWVFDQTVNDRGVPVDRVFVEKMYKLALRAKQEALDAQNAITGLANSNSRDQVLPWLKARGYPFSTVRKETVDSHLRDPDSVLTPEARQVLIKRREASSTTYTKLPSILAHISSDNMLKGLFVFLGSPRCGRWASGATQVHNMARPGNVGRVVDKDGVEIHPGYDFEDDIVVREARAMIMAEQYDEIKEKYKSVLLVIKNLIRTVFSCENL